MISKKKNFSLHKQKKKWFLTKVQSNDKSIVLKEWNEFKNKTDILLNKKKN